MIKAGHGKRRSHSRRPKLSRRTFGSALHIYQPYIWLTFGYHFSAQQALREVLLFACYQVGSLVAHYLEHLDLDFALDPLSGGALPREGQADPAGSHFPQTLEPALGGVSSPSVACPLVAW